MSTQDKQLYVIAYDIPSDRRRSKVHNMLCGYGRWTQFSLFECWLTAKQSVALYARLHRLLHPQEDHVRLYRLCAGCVKDVETLGGRSPHDDDVFLL